MAKLTGTITTPSSPPGHRPRANQVRFAAGTAGLAALCLGLATIAGGAASASTRAAAATALDAGHAGRYGTVLVDSHGFSLYTLANSAGRTVCKGKCLSFWPPFAVSKSTKHVALGNGVTGEVGFLPLTKTTNEVTFDGYPVYTFVKDTAPGQAHGEGIVAFGGTWELLRPAALIAPPKKAATGGATTTTGYGYK